MPCISFKFVKLRIKNIRHFKQGASQSKMAGTGFHSIAKLRAQIRNAVLADRCVFQADCHRENCHTADCYSLRTEFESRMPKAWTDRRVRIRPERGLAIRSTFKSWLPSNYSYCGKPWHSSAEVSKRVKSSPRHFTSRDCLFEILYLFKAWLYQFKTNTQSIV
jgi:hypothetical protein